MKRDLDAGRDYNVEDAYVCVQTIREDNNNIIHSSGMCVIYLFALFRHIYIVVTT